MTHLVGWAPAVVTAVMSASNSSLQMCKFSGVGTGCGGSIQFIFANVQIYHKMVNNLLRSYKILKKVATADFFLLYKMMPIEQSGSGYFLPDPDRTQQKNKSLQKKLLLRFPLKFKWYLLYELKLFT